MALCKFFLQGKCRFGENCKFEHQYPSNSQQHSSIIRQQNFTLTNNTPTGAPVDTADLIRSVTTDMLAVEKGGQWLLSSFAPFKEKSVFPGFEDHSFEEIRYGYYTAKNNGTLDVYVHQLTLLLQEAMMRVKSLQNPTQEAVAIMRSIYDEHVEPTTNNFTSSNPSVFGNTQSSVFNSPPTNANVFAQPNNVANLNIQPQTQSAQSIFAAANQSLFRASQPPAFNNGNQSIFANPLQISNNPFAQTFKPENSSGFQQTQTFANNTPGGFINAPFSSSSNVLPFASTVQNSNSQFIAQQQPQTGTSIFNTQTNVSNSPLIMQNNTSTSFNAPLPQTTSFNNSSGTFTNIQQTRQQLTSQPTPNFPQATSIFNSNVTSTNFNAHPLGIVDESVYSKPDELSESDIRSYQADAFEFGKVPEKPPHISMC